MNVGHDWHIFLIHVQIKNGIKITFNCLYFHNILKKSHIYFFIYLKKCCEWSVFRCALHLFIHKNIFFQPLILNPADGGLPESTDVARGDWINPHPPNFAPNHFPCPKIGMLMPKGISNHGKFVSWNYCTYAVRGGSVNMTISDMSQKSG